MSLDKTRLTFSSPGAVYLWASKFRIHGPFCAKLNDGTVFEYNKPPALTPGVTMRYIGEDRPESPYGSAKGQGTIKMLAKRSRK